VSYGVEEQPRTPDALRIGVDAEGRLEGVLSLDDLLLLLAGELGDLAEAVRGELKLP